MDVMDMLEDFYVDVYYAIQWLAESLMFKKCFNKKDAIIFDM